MEFPAHVGYNFTPTIHSDIYPAIDASKSDLTQPGKAVLITGSGRGIGRSIALHYAASNVADIILCARTASELDETETAINKINNKVKVHKFPLDVVNSSQVATVASYVKKEIGKLDVLVNNAGTSSGCRYFFSYGKFSLRKREGVR